MFRNTQKIAQRYILNTIKKYEHQQLAPLKNQVKINQMVTHRQIRLFGWFSKKEDERANLLEESEEEYNSWQNISHLIDKLQKENEQKQKLLPPQSEQYKGKLTVVLEMDDVFLHTFYPDELEGYMQAPQRDHDFYLDFPEYNTFLSIYKRDHLAAFLEYLKNECEAIIFSTGVSVYVDKVLDLIDPHREIFIHRLYQEACSKVEFSDENIADFVKDLNLLNRDLNRTVYLDTRPFTFWCNPDNGKYIFIAIPVLEFTALKNEKDNELLQLIEILEEVKQVDDVKEYLSDRFGIKELLQESKML